MAAIDPTIPQDSAPPPPPEGGPEAAPVDDGGIPMMDAPPPPIEIEAPVEAAPIKWDGWVPRMPYPFNLSPRYNSSVGTLQRYIRYNFLNDAEIDALKKGSELSDIASTHARLAQEYADRPADALDTNNVNHTLYERHKEVANLAQDIRHELRTHDISRQVVKKMAEQNGISDKDAIGESQQEIHKNILNDWVAQLLVRIETLEAEAVEKIMEKVKTQKKENLPQNDKPAQDPEPIRFPSNNKIGHRSPIVDDLLKGWQSPDGVAPAILDEVSAKKLALALPKYTETKTRVVA